MEAVCCAGWLRLSLDCLNVIPDDVLRRGNRIVGGVEEEGALSPVVLDAHPAFATGGNRKCTCNPVVRR